MLKMSQFTKLSLHTVIWQPIIYYECIDINVLSILYCWIFAYTYVATWPMYLYVCTHVCSIYYMSAVYAFKLSLLHYW